MDKDTFLRASFWSLMTICFGLLHLWITLLVCGIDEIKIFDSKTFILGCGLLFFASSLSIRFSIDYFTTMKGTKRDIGYVGLFYMLVPFLIVLFSSIIFLVCFYGNPKLAQVKVLQIAIVIVSAIYAFSMRYSILKSR